MKLWDLKSGKCIHTFTGHTKGIGSITYDARFIASGSRDKVSDSSLILVHKMYQSFAMNFIMQMEHQLIFVCKQTIRLWDMKMRRSLHTYKGHTNSVRCMRFDNRRLVSGSWDNTIKVLFYRTHLIRKEKCSSNCAPNNCSFYCIQIWDLVNGERLANLSGHTDRVLTLQFDDYKIGN